MNLIKKLIKKVLSLFDKKEVKNEFVREDRLERLNTILHGIGDHEKCNIVYDADVWKLVMDNGVIAMEKNTHDEMFMFLLGMTIFDVSSPEPTPTIPKYWIRNKHYGSNKK